VINKLTETQRRFLKKNRNHWPFYRNASLINHVITDGIYNDSDKKILNELADKYKSQVEYERQINIYAKYYNEIDISNKWPQ